MRAALGRHPGHLGPLGSEAAAGGLLTAFRRLRRLDAGGPPARSRGRHAEVRSMYATFRGVVAGHHDAEDRARSAAAAVAAGEPHTLDAGHVVLHLPGTLSPAETELVARLADLGRLSAVLATTGDPVADEPVLALVGTLERLTGTTVRGGTDPRSGRGGVATDPLIVSAPDPEEEIREAVRLMLDRASSGGVAFHHMAILYADPEPYATIADQVLAEAGVLRHGPGPRRLGDSVAGRALVGLLELAAEGPDPLGIERWLAGTPATDPGAFPRGPGGSGPDHLVERQAAELQPPVPATWASLATWARSLLDTYLDPEGVRIPGPIPRRNRSTGCTSRSTPSRASTGSACPPTWRPSARRSPRSSEHRAEAGSASGRACSSGGSAPRPGPHSTPWPSSAWPRGGTHPGRHPTRSWGQPSPPVGRRRPAGTTSWRWPRPGT